MYSVRICGSFAFPCPGFQRFKADTDTDTRDLTAWGCNKAINGKYVYKEDLN